MHINMGKIWTENVILEIYQVQLVSEFTYRGYQSSNNDQTVCIIIAANTAYFITLPLLKNDLIFVSRITTDKEVF